jgi:hypothetical protein
MNEKNTVPVFREADRNNLDFVRQIVLYRLKHDDDWRHLDYHWHHDRYVQFENRGLRNRFIELANEVMWQLIIQRIITPGMNRHNPQLPFFRITNYGKKVLEAESSIPHDPTDYLSELQSAASTLVGQVAIAYIEEALRCFNSGCHVASVLLLGVAAESVFLELCSVVASSITNASAKNEFEHKRFIRPKHRWIVDRYLQLPSSERRENLPESLDITLTSLYELIRRQRNDLGHPQQTPPTLDREQAFIFFRLFPGFVHDVEAFSAYCKSNGI